MKVKFVPQNIEYEIKPGEPVLHLAQDHNIHIRSVCRGVPSCAECRVRVVAGEHNVIPPSKTELGLIGTAYFVDGRRLSCQLRCFGDITVDLTEQIDNQGATKKMRGKYNKDEMQESRAVMGNLIMNDEPRRLEDADSVATPVAALGPDGVPTSEEDEIDIASDNHEAHLAASHHHADDDDQDDQDDDDELDEKPRAQGGPGRPQARAGGAPAQPQAAGEGGQKKRRRRRGGRGRRGGGGGGQGGPGGPGGGGGGGSRPTPRPQN